jgi:hypothetical protein
MTKAERTLELLVRIPLVTHCVFYHPKLKKKSGSSFLICIVYVVCRRVAERLWMTRGKDMEGSGCGLVMMKLGVLGADNKIIFVRIGWWFFFFFIAQQPLVCRTLIIEVSQSHSDTPHSVGLVWTVDWPDAATSTWQHPTLTKGRRPCPRRDSNQ